RALSLSRLSSSALARGIRYEDDRKRRARSQEQYFESTARLCFFDRTSWRWRMLIVAFLSSVGVLVFRPVGCGRFLSDCELPGRDLLRGIAAVIRLRGFFVKLLPVLRSLPDCFRTTRCG